MEEYSLCGDLNINGHHRLICLDPWSRESGTLSEYGIVGVIVTLLEEVCHCGAGFKVLYAQLQLVCP